MIDLHSHILRGIDDGARTMEESIEIARAALADGITVIAGTPHVRDDWPTDASVMEYRVAELRAELQLQGIALDVRQGGEIAFDWLGKLPVETLRRFGLGGNPRYLLVETPYYGWPLDLAERLFRLHAAGITPVLAHPERNYDVQARPALLEPIVAGGTLVQLTATSLDGRGSSRAKACAVTLLQRELAHLLASDAHEPGVRAIGLSAAARVVGGELARWLTLDVPRAIVEDTALPPRPKRSSARRLLARSYRPRG